VIFAPMHLSAVLQTKHFNPRRKPRELSWPAAHPTIKTDEIDMAEPERIAVEEARRKVVTGDALLVCAYPDDEV
jgi:hypothetical protein